MDKCYWIAIPGRMARCDCDRSMIYLNKSMKIPESEMLEPYRGDICPKCGKPICMDEHSYDLIKS